MHKNAKSKVVKICRKYRNYGCKNSNGMSQASSGENNIYHNFCLDDGDNQ